jgi:hypothetical protein
MRNNQLNLDCQSVDEYYNTNLETQHKFNILCRWLPSYASSQNTNKSQHQRMKRVSPCTGDSLYARGCVPAKRRVHNNRHFDVKLEPEFSDAEIIICVPFPDKPGEGST